MAEWAACEHFAHLEAGSGIGHVIEQAERGSGFAGALRIVAASGVGDIDLAEDLACEFGEVGVVADVGEELAVGLAHSFPVGAVHVGAEEAFFGFGEHVVIHVFAFGRGIEFLSGREAYAVNLSAGEAHLAD